MWSEGEVVTRREVLSDGRCWMHMPVVVVRDEPGLLATYIAEETPFTFPPGDWPIAAGGTRGTTASAGTATAA